MIDRVERGHRVLEDHRDVAAADVAQLVGRHGRAAAVPSKDTEPATRTPRSRQQAHDGQRRHATCRSRTRRPGRWSARASTVNETPSTARTSRAVAAAERDPQVLDLEQGHGSPPALRVEGLAQRLAEQGEAERGDDDGRCRGRTPGAARPTGSAACRRASGPTPGSPGRRSPRPRNDRPAASMIAVARASVRLHDHRRERVGQDVRGHDRCVGARRATCAATHVVAVALGRASSRAAAGRRRGCSPRRSRSSPSSGSGPSTAATRDREQQARASTA